MGDGFEIAPSGRVGKDDGPQRPPIEIAVGRHHALAEALADGGECRGARGDDLARDLVAVDHRHSAGSKEFGDAGFAACNATGESDFEHRARLLRIERPRVERCVEQQTAGQRIARHHHEPARRCEIRAEGEGLLARPAKEKNQH